MGTEVNLALLKEIGLLSAEAASAKPNDLVIAIEPRPGTLQKRLAGLPKRS